MQMLPEAWKEEMGFTCSWAVEKGFFMGMVWCKIIFFMFSLDFAMYSVAIGHSWRAAQTVLLSDELVLFPAYLCEGKL